MEHFQNKWAINYLIQENNEHEKTNQTKFSCQSLIQSSLIAIADLTLQWATYICADYFY